MSDFSYLLEKIKEIDFTKKPFKHIYIENFFSENHFTKLTNSPQIKLDSAETVQVLINKLHEKGWKPRPFGGCTINEKAYIKWRKNTASGYQNTDTCSGFGMAYSSTLSESKFTEDLTKFLASEEFFSCLRDKFKISSPPYRVAAGCHKYLKGYEISPHPDSRNKALTYMININPNPESERKIIILTIWYSKKNMHT